MTGAIYYNSRIKGAAAAGTGAMEGEGWKYMGGNGMFATGRFLNTDFNIVTANGGSVVFNNYTGCVDMELSIDGKKAKSVMKSVGYKQVPTQVIRYNNTYNQDMPGPPGHTFHFTYGTEIEYAEKSAYVPNSCIEIERKNVGTTEYGKYNAFLNSTPYADRQTISYAEPGGFSRVLRVISPWLSAVHGGLHDYVDRYYGHISDYHGGNKLIDRILAR